MQHRKPFKVSPPSTLLLSQLPQNAQCREQTYMFHLATPWIIVTYELIRCRERAMLLLWSSDDVPSSSASPPPTPLPWNELHLVLSVIFDGGRHCILSSKPKTRSCVYARDIGDQQRPHWMMVTSSLRRRVLDSGYESDTMTQACDAKVQGRGLKHSARHGISRMVACCSQSWFGGGSRYDFLSK